MKISREAVGELKRLFQMFYLSGMNGTQALKEASRDGAYPQCRSAGVHRVRAQLAKRDLSAGAVVTQRLRTGLSARGCRSGT